MSYYDRASCRQRSAINLYDYIYLCIIVLVIYSKVQFCAILSSLTSELFQKGKKAKDVMLINIPQQVFKFA